MKRVLIICYYWPPAGGPGVQRWLKFVKYFRDFQIEPVVYLPENPHYPIVDSSLLNEVLDGIEFLKTPIKEPYRLAKFLSKKSTQQMSKGIIDAKPSLLKGMMLAIRGNFYIPDARVGWVAPSVSFLNKYLSENTDIKTIITTGPPHSLHLIGFHLKTKVPIHWIADFRDPWTSIHYHKSLQLSRRNAKRHKDLEQQVLQGADAITVTSPSTKKEFEQITSKPIHLITNGFDDEEVTSEALDKNFSLVHIGSLLSNRNPIILWECLKELTKENEAFRGTLKIRLVGSVSEDVLDTIQQYGLKDHLEYKGYVSHDRALAYMYTAQVLLLIEMNTEETKMILPGKLYEYLRAGRPILSLGPKGSDIETILNETQGGTFFTYEDKASLKATLFAYFNLYKSGILQVNSKNTAQFHRKKITEKYSNLIKSFV